MRAKLWEGWVGLGTEHSPSSQGSWLPLSSLGQLDFPFWSSVSTDRIYPGIERSVTQIAISSSVTGRTLLVLLGLWGLSMARSCGASYCRGYACNSESVSRLCQGRAADTGLTPAAGSCLGTAWGCDIVPLSSCRPCWVLRQLSAAWAGWSSLGMAALSCGWVLSTLVETCGDSPRPGFPPTPIASSVDNCSHSVFALPQALFLTFSLGGGEGGQWEGDG